MNTFWAVPVAVLCCNALQAQSADLFNPQLSAPFNPLSVKAKFNFATQETLRVSTFISAGITAGFSQWSNTNPSFGQGLEGYSNRYGRALLNRASDNYLSDAILPALFHEDPRYFRKGQGTVTSRALWAATRVAVGRKDSGEWGFNTSEVLGAGMSASIGNAYFPDRVGFGYTMQRMGSRLGGQIGTNILAEFLPDIKKILARRKKTSTAPVQ